uniref:Uncharacterized protein n=1 Tax=Panagrolaimus sp. ES5 TaxID=591445 RepID=A0AC34FRU5_9BILA
EKFPSKKRLQDKRR